MFRVFMLLSALMLAVPARAADAGPQPPACAADALGTSRVATIGDQGPFALGLKTYPETLALADHEVVLTFDDGPSRTTTPRVLAALARECVRATFFLIGRNALAAPALVRQEVAVGHSVGSHSFSHPEITLRSTRRGSAASIRLRASLSSAPLVSPTPPRSIPVWRRATLPSSAPTSGLRTGSR